MFKRGDFVRVKPGTRLDTGEIVDNWGGEVFHVNKDDGVCGISLDAPSLDALSDDYLRYAMKQGEEAVEYFFAPEVLEHATARSTDDEIIAAIDRLVDREVEIERVEEEQSKAQYEAWKSAFRESPIYEQLANVETINIDMALNTFLEYMHRYEDARPWNWAPNHVKEVCLHWAPAKITADPEDFKDYGTVVMAFLSFLGQAGHISHADELIQAVEQVKDRIPIEAAKEINWGPAKSIMMSAKAQGYDLSSEEAIKDFIRQQQMQAPMQQQPMQQHPYTEPPEDLFKGIGRNQKITVQYEDGTTKADIKFKKVEKDLRAGRCELIKR